LEATTVTSGDEREGFDGGQVVTPSAGEALRPGDLLSHSYEPLGPEPMVGDDVSSAMEEDEPEGTVPPCPLWAMKEHRHIQWHLLPSHERHDRLRVRIGDGDDVLYVIDDGRHHVMLGRRVGEVPGEVEYCLTGRAPRERYEELERRAIPPSGAFAGASELTLSGVAVAADIRSSNIFSVALYDESDEIPAEYLPGSPFQTFREDLEITAD
jgi:hypothetical protein